MTEQSHRYDDILHMPHHVSEKHPQMSMIDRAAQFSPFAALTGYEAAIDETARWTDAKRELTEEEQQIISEKLHALKSHEKETPEVEMTCFVQDMKKAGGSYETFRGRIKKIDELAGRIELQDRMTVFFDDLLDISEV